MPQFSVDLDVLRHALLDHSLSQVGDSLLEAKVTSPLKIAQLAFSPKLDVQVLNRADDRDTDAVFGSGDSAHIAYATQSAWLKYTLTAKAEAKLPISVIKTSGGADVALSDYRRHAATDSAWGAVTQDLSAPRTLLELDDVKALQPGEALAMELGGALTAAVSFSWSDLLATRLVDVVSELPIAIKLKSGLVAKASVKLTDHFSIVVSRTLDHRFRFAVTKAVSRSHAYGIEVSVGLDAGATDVAAEIIAQLPNDVAVKVADTLVSRLEKAVRWKAETGFAYEYARIDENESIADFILLDDSLLAGDHALVLSGDFEKVADALRRDPQSRTLVRYLNESTLTRRSSFGFSLGLGKWALTAKETSSFRMTTRTSLDGFKLVTAQGTRKYDEKNVPQNDFEWVIDLKAQMEDFKEQPASLDFDYGLHLMATIERGAISEGDLTRVIDFARMWGVQTPPLAEFAEAIGKKGTLRMQLLLERGELLAAFAEDVDLESWATPLAAAMPYSSKFPERRTYEARIETYAKAWQAWLNDGPPAPLQLQSGLAILEKQGGVDTFARISGEGHPHLRQNLEAFARGAKRLHALMTTAQSPAAIGNAYDALSELWSQRLYVAALGYWLVARGATRATLQVAYDDVTVTT